VEAVEAREVAAESREGDSLTDVAERAEQVVAQLPYLQSPSVEQEQAQAASQVTHKRYTPKESRDT
jgi:hypothetical protein